MASALAEARLAEFQRIADAVLARCERTLVPIADAPLAEQAGGCAACANLPPGERQQPDVRIEMRTAEPMTGLYPDSDGSMDIPVSTPMFWCNACPDHHDVPVEVSIS